MENSCREGDVSDSTSASLLKRIREFDPHGWQRLFKLYGPLVYRWARQAELQSHDATDLGQEVFRTVMSRIDSFKKEKPGDSFRAWLWTITRNKLQEHWRVQAKQPRPMGSKAEYLQHELPDEPPENESAEVQAATRQSILQRALELVRGDFEKKTWEAFWRLAVSKDKAAEIAGDLQMTPRAIRQAKYRVLRRLRDEFGELT